MTVTIETDQKYISRIAGLMKDKILQCESCNKQCDILHNCTETPHSIFDVYDGVIYCNECHGYELDYEYYTREE